MRVQGSPGDEAIYSRDKANGDRKGMLLLTLVRSSSTAIIALGASKTLLAMNGPFPTTM